MRWCARYGLQSVVCVSQAVSNECVNAGYPAKKLTVIHNGLPGLSKPPEQKHNPVPRLGFLGVFSERKGLRDLFFALDELARTNSVPWQAVIAEPQETLPENPCWRTSVNASAKGIGGRRCTGTGGWTSRSSFEDPGLADGAFL